MTDTVEQHPPTQELVPLDLTIGSIGKVVIQPDITALESAHFCILLAGALSNKSIDLRRYAEDHGLLRHFSE